MAPTSLSASRASRGVFAATQLAEMNLHGLDVLHRPAIPDGRGPEAGQRRDDEAGGKETREPPGHGRRRARRRAPRRERGQRHGGHHGGQRQELNRVAAFLEAGPAIGRQQRHRERVKDERGGREHDPPAAAPPEQPESGQNRERRQAHSTEPSHFTHSTEELPGRDHEGVEPGHALPGQHADQAALDLRGRRRRQRAAPGGEV